MKRELKYQFEKMSISWRMELYYKAQKIKVYHLFMRRPLDLENEGKFCNALVKCKALQTINLSCNILSLNTEICKSLAECTELQIIDWKNTPFNEIEMEEENYENFGYMLSKLKNLHTINFKNGCLGRLDEGWGGLFELFCNELAKGKALQIIDLSYNDLNFLNVLDFEALGNALLKCQELHTIDLSGNNLGGVRCSLF